MRHLSTYTTPEYVCDEVALVGDLRWSSHPARSTDTRPLSTVTVAASLTGSSVTPSPSMSISALNVPSGNSANAERVRRSV